LSQDSSSRGFAIVGILLLGASALLDVVDGTIAREFAVATLFGGILDLCSDRVVEIAMITGITWRRPELYFPELIFVGRWYSGRSRGVRAPQPKAYWTPARTRRTHGTDNPLCRLG
jgi:phosphatidylglycerophosphate synthase